MLGPIPSRDFGKARMAKYQKEARERRVRAVSHPFRHSQDQMEALIDLEIRAIFSEIPVEDKGLPAALLFPGQPGDRYPVLLCGNHWMESNDRFRRLQGAGIPIPIKET